MTTLLEASRLALEALEKLSDAADGFSVSGVYFNEEHWAKECLNKSYDAITSLRQAIEQAQKQEAVLWLVNGVVQSSDLPKDYTGCLYTSPPQRQPLTFEQRMRICNECGDSVTLAILLTEDAHGIKE